MQEQLGMKHIATGEVIAQHKCYDGHDDKLDTHILDEDKLLDILEPMFQQYQQQETGIVLDFHVCEIFPERWFDLVLVLRTQTEILFDRLQARHYSEQKRDQNMQSEIMQVVLEEAREAYDKNIVHEVQSNTLKDMNANVQRVQDWTKQWIADHVQEEES